MVTLELFLTPDWLSAPSATALAEEAVKQAPGVKLIIRSERENLARAKSLCIFIDPAVVL